MSDPIEDEQLAAYALNACEPSEAQQIEEYLAEHPEAAAELVKLSTAAASIGATEALTPPSRLRNRVLEAAGAGRSAGNAGDGEALALFRDQTDRLDELAAGLGPADLSAPTSNGLSVRDLVVHLAAMESMVAAGLWATAPPVVATIGVEERTAAFVEEFAVRPLDEVRSLWRQSVDSIADWAETGATTGPLAWLGQDADRHTILVIRAFETWIHADDIRRALGRSLEPPAPAHLHRMAEFSMQSLPGLLQVVGRPHPGRAARVVLTGAGGGSWLVPLELGEANDVRTAGIEVVDVVLEADVVDWCHRVAERLSSAEIAVQITGSDELAADILEAASAMAML